jgi:hypothetical protein
LSRDTADWEFSFRVLVFRITNPDRCSIPVHRLVVPRLSDAYLRHEINLTSVLPSLQVHYARVRVGTFSPLHGGKAICIFVTLHTNRVSRKRPTGRPAGLPLAAQNKINLSPTAHCLLYPPFFYVRVDMIRQKTCG